MLQCVEGVYREGTIELLERPPDLRMSRVIVTFLPSKEVDLRARGISEAEAADIRWRMGAIGEDWDRPEMDVYDEL